MNYERPVSTGIQVKKDKHNINSCGATCGGRVF